MSSQPTSSLSPPKSSSDFLMQLQNSKLFRKGSIISTSSSSITSPSTSSASLPPSSPPQETMRSVVTSPLSSVADSFRRSSISLSGLSLSTSTSSPLSTHSMSVSFDFKNLSNELKRCKLFIKNLSDSSPSSSAATSSLSSPTQSTSSPSSISLSRRISQGSSDEEHVKKIIDELIKTENSFLVGATKLGKQLEVLYSDQKKYGKNHFVHMYHGRVQNVVKSIESFQSILVESSKQDDLLDKLESLNEAYSSMDFDLYGENLISLTPMVGEFEKLKPTIRSKIVIDNSSDPTSSHPIIFIQRILRHILLINQINETITRKLKLKDDKGEEVKISLLNVMKLASKMDRAASFNNQNKGLRNPPKQLSINIPTIASDDIPVFSPTLKILPTSNSLPPANDDSGVGAPRNKTKQKAFDFTSRPRSCSADSHQ